MNVRLRNFRRARRRLATIWFPLRGSLSRLAVLTAIVAALALSACSHQVGDSCATNVECSPLGDRFCDISSPGGYCTVEGCDSTSCPDNSTCVRFFSLQRGAPACTAGKVARTDCQGGADCCKPGDPLCCRLGERCLCDDVDCKKSYCASETSEHRWCMHSCGSSSDCRDGYQCYSTGERGAIAVATLTDGGLPAPLPVVNYCAPTRGE